MDPTSFLKNKFVNCPLDGRRHGLKIIETVKQERKEESIPTGLFHNLNAL